MQAALPLALLTALVAVAEGTQLTVIVVVAQTEQATRSCDRDSECVLQTNCSELQELLQAPVKDAILQLPELRCGIQGTEVMVCCPTSHHLPTKGESPNPPTAAPTKEEPPTPPITFHSTEGPPTTSTTSPPRSGEALLTNLCGLIPPLNKIWLGTTAQEGEYPWSAVLGFRGRDADPVFWGCGGSLISERYVLTAAHCTVSSMTDFKELSIIRLGEYNLDSDEECFGKPRRCFPVLTVLDFTPEEIVHHPDFNTREVYSDDVALIRLDRTVTFSGYIQPVCLPAPGKTFSDVIGDLIPMGIGFEEKESGVRSAKLRHVTVVTVPMKKCQSIYNSTMETGEGQVCLGGQEKQDVCLNHPGAPVSVHLTPYGPPFAQVGIMSYAEQPCRQDVPALYTDVTYYRDWIVNNLKP